MLLTTKDLDTRKPLSLNDSDSFIEYCKVVKDDFCPFIAPSFLNNLMYSSKYNIKDILAGDSLEDLSESIFYISLLHVELFRKKRNELLGQDKFLLCDNVILTGDHDFTSDQLRQVLSWSHWILKTLYSPVGIMFGKFWRGEVDFTQYSKTPIPIPQVTFISIRSAIKPRDSQFLDGQPTLSNLILSSNDNSEYVHPIELDLSSFDTLKKSFYYSKAKEWSKTFL